MAHEKPESRPEPPTPKEPSVYGGQWGQSGKQSEPEGVRETDRPDKIEVPDEKPGAGEEGSPRVGG